MSGFEWLSYLAEWLGKWVPRLLIVDVTEGGVKMRRGHEVSELRPGIHLYWPIITNVRVVMVVRDTLDLDAQTFTTKDGKVMAASGMVLYSIRDVVKTLTECPDYTNTIRDQVMNCIHNVLINYTYDEIKEGILSGAIGKELRKACQDSLAGFGLRILNVGLKDLAPCRVIKLLNGN